MASPSPGLQLGPYELLSRIGSGGMGEVWRARDTRLNRIVAVKFSKEKYSERFRGEARVIASINHPNVATLHDVGDDFLVMEYVEGDPLRSPGTIRQLLELAVQTAAGLAAAHSRGIVHRDLKPDNILIAKDGRVKILDFGLARRTSPASPDDETRTATVTQSGALTGTPVYMSPEQARGDELDMRSDQFTFGVILHTLITGKRPFDRDSTVETLAAIIRDDPAPLPPETPAPFRWIVERCLAKDPSERYASTEDLYRELKILSQRFSELTSASPSAAPRRKTPMRWLAAIAFLLAATTAVTLLFRPHADLNAGITFTPISAEPGREWYGSFSPDGNSIAYSREVNGVAQVFVRPLASDAASQLTSLPSDCVVYFWSADGDRIYFVQARDLWSISAAGGKPQLVLKETIVPARSPDGKAVIIGSIGSPPKILVSSPIGAPPRELAVLPLETDKEFGMHVFSPDGSKILITVLRGAAFLVDYPSGRLRRIETVQNSAWASWLPDSRHVLLTRRSPDYRLVLVDTMAEGHEQTILSALEPARSAVVSGDGKRIVFVNGGLDDGVMEVSINGELIRSLADTPFTEYGATWSPRGDRIVYNVQGRGIWIRNADGSDPRPLSADRDAMNPVFSPDGRRIAYRVGDGIFLIRTDGGNPVRLKPSAGTGSGALCWSPDGEWLAYTDGPSTGGRLWKLAAEGNNPPVELHGNAVNVALGSCSWSPDSKTIAYRGDNGIHAISAAGEGDHLILPFAAPFGNIPFGFRQSGELIAAIREGNPPSTKLVTLDLNDGRRTSSTLLNIEGRVIDLSFHPNGKEFAATVRRDRQDLWMMEGFPRPATGWRRLLGHWMAPK